MQNSITIVAIILLFSTTLKAQSTDNYSKEWYKVESFELENLPKSALKEVKKIYTKAKKDNNDAQLIKSLLYISKFTLTLEEDAQLNTILNLKKEAKNSKFPTKNILESIIADIYWQYFQRNRWKIYNRTNTAEKIDSIDFRTWDLQTIFEETHSHFQKSLTNSIGLQKTDLSEYNTLLHLQKDSKKYRPTLYDFLAHRAIDFYKTDEGNLNRPSYKFEIDNPDLLAPNKTFVKNQMYAKDSLSQQLHALRLYKNLTLSHLKDKDPTAIVDLTLERIEFVKSNAVFNNVDSIYLETLKSLKEQFNTHEVVTEIDYKIALLYNTQANLFDPKKNDNHRWKRKTALEICRTAIAKFPKSKGAQKCKSLESDILYQSLEITSEQFIPIQTPSRLLVSYKNTEQLYFTAFKISTKQKQRLNDTYQESEKIEMIKKLKTVKTWNTSLKNENDYQQHTTEVLLPELEQGNYIIFASTNKEISTENTYGFTFIQVSNIALIENTLEGKNSYQVVDRNSGKPLQNARVHIKNYNTGRYNKPINKTLISDKNGQVHFKIDTYIRNVVVTIRTKNDEAVFGDYYLYENRKQTVNEIKNSRIFLFTDRSIYRPGQTVYFKGIAVTSEKNKSLAVENKQIEIRLNDVNYQEVKALNLKTNEFGSFSGEFVLPSTGLTGNFNIHASSNFHFGNALNGSTYFSVEEYKRPKFETEFKPITETFRVNDSITVNGFATAFSGSTITDAKVSYRVVRTAQFPRWYWWYYGDNSNSESLEIAHGKTVTDASGNFKIKFKAIPDASLKKDAQPTFTYQVFADVTDINGETRSTSTNVNVGYHALTIDISINDKLDKLKKDHKITLTTNNLNGEFVPAKGSVKIFKLKNPEKPLRTRPWEYPDYQTFSKEEFKELFPHEAYQNESDPNTWDKGKLVFESEFNTEKSKEIALKNISKWQSGNYVIIVETKDKFGQPVKDEHRFEAFSDNDKTVADNNLFFIKTNKNSYKPNEFVKLKVGSASENLYVTITVLKKYRVTETRVVHLSNDIKTINIPVNSEDEGGFSVHYQLVNYNSFNKGSININVPYPPHNLTIETTTFRDKLQPGQNETWSFKIKGTHKDKVAAELLASMYDASLDQFKSHNWYFNPIYQPSYYSYDRSTANHSFGNTTFTIHYKAQQYYGFSYQNYDQLNWFGFSLTNSWFNNSYLSSIRYKHAPDSVTSSTDTNKEGGYIYGNVSDESGPLPGVNVVIKGTSSGVQTDFDGNFRIKATKGDVLVFSFVGMNTAEITIKSDNVYNIRLRADEQSLDEVVVTGYGSRIKNKKLNNQLSGNIAGVQKMEVTEDEMVVEETVLEDSSAPLVTSTYEEKNTDAQSSLKGIVARKNLQETAFFYPHLKTDKEGNVSFNFTIPESLTRWNLNLLAHTKDMATAQMQLSTVTQKELMVMPNPPRFLREGDAIVFASKISNLTENKLDGISELQLFDALTDKPIDDKLGNSDNRKYFTVDAKGNTNVSWTLTIPFDVQAVKYRIIAKAGDFTDGEENVLPVLSNRMLVTESLPMWLRSNETKTFTLDKLKNNTSTSLKHHKLTLEITSNPAWYAVQAMPYLMEYPYECSEQTFSRYYSNALASHIVNSNPRIQEVFNQWKNSDALLSNLEKNQELKSLIIEETPWLRDAQSETEQKKRIALLFDLNKMKNELDTALRKLEQTQMNNGGFPWFKGSRYPNRYITQYIASGFGHLNKLGVTHSGAERMIKKAVQFLDDEILTDYNELKKTANRIRKEAKTKAEGIRLEKEFWENNHTHHFQIQYLYMRSFYKDITLRNNVKTAVDYFTNQAYEFWQNNNLYTKGMISLIAKRNNEPKVAEKIIASLKENSISSEELGMYWKDNTASWFWYQAPIETQALLIEAFSEVEGDLKTIDNLKVWLLKNKQTNRWKTTKATTEAIYALLLQGTDWLEVTEFVEVTIGDQKVDPLQLEDTKVEAGTGYFKTSWNGNEVKENMATVTLSKKTEGIAWGALYWQYFEDLDKITSAKTPLQLSKKLFLKKNTDKGEELNEITETTHLKLGDLVRVRIELKVDRPMEFVHMKDMRAAGFEPINVLSQYKWQDNLGYYESTKDAATNFFFDYLPKGVYVFEYDLRVNNKGDFSNGITTIQSMYAPEFSSHSEGVRIKVQ
ncbi:alpha-2-macroglobulin [Aureibaculum marinum]|uniref:Alpha-2-macroglobulin n=2 Tax=Pseudomonadati TaxID=3379134 RepID=A0A3N4NGI5_9FLAO|nr:carboxypeptidase-like regulatory domain-containing protein [Aureibaculum marinum]RPD93447.1 alpha-2-macroglobulin [Aureibaculum marinum]